MEIKEAVLSALKEVIFPEIQDLKKNQLQVQGRLEVVQIQLEGIHKRLDDQTSHLADQSRRLDELRQDLTGRIDQVRSELSGRIDRLDSELTSRIDTVDTRQDQMRAEISSKIDQVDTRLVQVRAELNGRLDHVTSELAELTRSLATLYKVIISRDEYQHLQERVARIENQVAELRQKVAA